MKITCAVPRYILAASVAVLVVSSGRSAALPMRSQAGAPISGAERAGDIEAGGDTNPAATASDIISHNPSPTYKVTYAGGTLQGFRHLLDAADTTLDSTNGAIGFDRNGKLIAETGICSGSRGLRKVGAGTLQMKSSSSYTASTEVNDGLFSLLLRSVLSQVNVNGGRNIYFPPQPNDVLLSAVGAAAALKTWKGDGTSNIWDVNNSVNWNNNSEKFFQLDIVFFDDGGSNIPPVNLVGVLQPGGVTVSGTKDYTFAGTGTISGPAGLTKSSTGLLTINSGAHDFSGAVSLTGTTVITALRSAGQASSIGAGNAIELAGTLRYTGTTTSTNRVLTFNGAGGRLDIIDPDAAVSLTSAVTGAGKLTKTGDGTLVLPAANTYPGGTDILGGSLRLTSNDKPLGDGFAVSIDEGATLDVNGIGGLGATRRYDVSVGPLGGRILNLGNSVVGNPIYRSLNLGGDLIIETSTRYDLSGGTVDGTGVTVNGNLFSLTKRGTGETWWAPNPGATIGDIFVDAGTFGVRSSGNLGDNNRSIIVSAAGQLSTFSAVTNAKPIILNGGLLASSNATSTWTGTVTLLGFGLGNGATNRIGGSGPGTGVIITGQVTGPGGLEKTNGSTLDLRNSTNNWVGGTLISGGTLIASVVGALPGTGVLMIGGVLELPSGIHKVGGLSGSGGAITGAGTLLLDGLASNTFGGTIADRVNLAVSNGTLTLTGASTTTGTTTVADMTFPGRGLIVDGSLAGSTIVNNLGKLYGRGTVGSVFLNSGGTIDPGRSYQTPVETGILNAGNTVFNGGTFQLELNGLVPGTSYDQLNITGTVNLGTNTGLSVFRSFDPVDGVDSFVILNNDGTEPITGFFRGLPEGALFTQGQLSPVQTFRITYAGGLDGNDIVLFAVAPVPEPGSFATLLGGFGTLLGFHRSRRRAV